MNESIIENLKNIYHYICTTRHTGLGLRQSIAAFSDKKPIIIVPTELHKIAYRETHRNVDVISLHEVSTALRGRNQPIIFDTDTVTEILSMLSDLHICINSTEVLLSRELSDWENIVNFIESDGFKLMNETVKLAINEKKTEIGGNIARLEKHLEFLVEKIAKKNK
jgi:hypothetical protein